jgi:hypothetical protein
MGIDASVNAIDAIAAAVGKHLLEYLARKICSCLAGPAIRDPRTLREILDQAMRERA